MPIKFSKPVKTKLPALVQTESVRPAQNVVSIFPPPLSPRLRTKDVLRLLNVCRQTLYNRIASKEFPEPDGNDGPRINWWKEETVRKYIESTTRKRDGGANG
jgi:predicted DNA-binding transcriptional regulator AlpA